MKNNNSPTPCPSSISGLRSGFFLKNWIVDLSVTAWSKYLCASPSAMLPTLGEGREGRRGKRKEGEGKEGERRGGEGREGRKAAAGMKEGGERKWRKEVFPD